MKKRNSKKGFTLVELVIVIAVIAILAGVLIPTFGGIVKKAQKSAAEQAAMNAWKEAYALDLSDGKLDGTDNTAKIEDSAETDKWTYGKDANSNVITFKYEDDNWTVEWKSDTKKWTSTEKTATSTGGTGENTNTEVQG